MNPRANLFPPGMTPRDILEPYDNSGDNLFKRRYHSAVWNLRKNKYDFIFAVCESHDYEHECVGKKTLNKHGNNYIKRPIQCLNCGLYLEEMCVIGRLLPQDKQSFQCIRCLYEQKKYPYG